MAFEQVRGLLLAFKKGDGESPEEFTAFCSITAKSVNFDGQENTFAIPDCEDQDAVDWLYSEMQSKRVTINGSGTLNAPDFDDFYEWWDGGEDSNGQLIIDIPAASGGRILEGAWKVPTFSLTGNKGELSTVTITIASSGPLSKTNNT